MGWSVTPGSTRKSIISERIRDWDTKKSAHKEKREHYVFSTVLRHCCRGNLWSGILWAIREQKLYDTATDKLVKTTRFITCDLLRYDKSCQGWGYKGMDEECGPCYYSCPLSYLEMVPEPDSEKDTGWRKIVREYHEVRKKRRETKREAKKSMAMGWTIN